MTTDPQSSNTNTEYYTPEELREYVKNEEPIVTDHLQVHHFRQIIKQVETLKWFFGKMSRDERFERFEIISEHVQKIIDKGPPPSVSDYDKMNYFVLLGRVYRLEEMTAELKAVRPDLFESTKSGKSRFVSLTTPLVNMCNRVKTTTVGFCESLKKKIGKNK